MKRFITTLALTALLSPAALFAATFTQSLSVGSRGGEVTSLQQVLVDAGFLKVAPTGYFGLLTKAAVTALQKANGLEAIGSVGPKTRGVLNALAAKNEPVAGTSPTPAAPTPTPTATPPATPPANPPAQTEVDVPVVSLVSPTTTLPRYAQTTSLVVSTTRDANCRWGTLPNAQFSYMTAFNYTGGTTHTANFSNLGGGNFYVYYVKCEDAKSFKISSDFMTSFMVGL